jgi:phage gp36-like protein
MPVTPKYIAQSDLEDLFGINNIAVWSNLDDTNTTADTNRIARAIVFAENYVESRLRGTTVAVPLDTVTPILTNIIATIAGYWLYSPRGMRDSDTVANRMKTMRDDVETLLESVADGSVAVEDIPTPSEPNGPSIVPIDNSDLRKPPPYNIPWPLP